MASNQYNDMASLYGLKMEKLNEIVVDVRTMMDELQLTIASLEKVAKEKEHKIEETEDFLENVLYIPGGEVNPRLKQELALINKKILLNRKKYLECVEILENVTSLRKAKIAQKYGVKITMNANDFAKELNDYVDGLESNYNTQLGIGFVSKK